MLSGCVLVWRLEFGCLFACLLFAFGYIGCGFVVFVLWLLGLLYCVCCVMGLLGCCLLCWYYIVRVLSGGCFYLLLWLLELSVVVLCCVICWFICFDLGLLVCLAVYCGVCFVLCG